MPDSADNDRPRRIATRLAAHPAALAFLLGFVAFLAVALLQGPKFFYYDSGLYWWLAGTFSQNGHFSLLNFENAGVRGYALPLIYYALRRLAEPFGSSETLMVMVFNSAVFASIGAVLAPGLARIAWPSIRWSVPRRLLLCGLLLIFWRGYLNFPLSDFPALAAAMLAVVSVSAFDKPLSMLIAGGAAALALDIRPAYLLLIPALLLLVAWGWLDQRGGDRASGRRRALCLVLFFVGIVVVSLPQSLSEHDKLGSYNPIPGGSELAGLQYTGGLQLQRYDTYVGTDPGKPVPAARMEYVDPHTRAILASLPDETVSGTGEYIELVIHHPVTLAGVFLRHVVNGLDLRYTTPYIEHLSYGGQDVLRFAGFLLAFLALLRIAWPAARRSLGPARWRYPATLALCCASSLPSAVETRFLLPVFILNSTLVLAPGWPSPLGPASAGLARYRPLALMILAATLFFAVGWVIVSGASDNLRLV